MTDREETMQQLEQLSMYEFVTLKSSELQRKIGKLFYLKKIVGAVALYYVYTLIGLNMAASLAYLYAGWKITSYTDAASNEKEYYIGIVFWLPLLFYGMLPDEWRIDK